MRPILSMLILLVASFGCGRVGFDAISASPSDDAGSDSASTGTARLAAIELWFGPGEPLASPLSPGFDPTVDRYGVDVDLMVQRVQISARPVAPGTTITIDGTAVASDELSPPIALALGATAVTVVGSRAGEAPMTYVVDITRAAQIAQRAYLKASNTEAGDRFAWSIAISGDTLAVGAPQEDSGATGVGGNDADNSAQDSGAVYVFTRTAGVWSQQAYIKASNTQINDQFGTAIALSGDTLAVGAWAESSGATGVNGDQTDNSVISSGAAYVFTRSAGVWSQQAYIKASNPRLNDHFGHALALLGDTLAVGAWQEDSGATGVGGSQTDSTAPDAGAVYVFARVGSTWSQQAYIKASNTGAGDHFGDSFGLHQDTLVVGARDEDSDANDIDGDQTDNTASAAGAAYVFTRVGGVWSQQGYLKASNSDAGDLFGDAVALWGDTVAIGALAEDSIATGVGGNQADNSAVSSGAVYVFTRTAGVWSQQAYLKASNSEVADQCGASVAIANDVLALGCTLEDSSATGVGGNQADNMAVSAGAVHLFSRTGTTWVQAAYLKASNTGASDYFGSSVVADGSTLLVAGRFEDSSATGVAGNQADDSALQSGAAYVFE